MWWVEWCVCVCVCMPLCLSACLFVHPAVYLLICIPFSLPKFEVSHEVEEATNFAEISRLATPQSTSLFNKVKHR